MFTTQAQKCLSCFLTTLGPTPSGHIGDPRTRFPSGIRMHPDPTSGFQSYPRPFRFSLATSPSWHFCAVGNYTTDENVSPRWTASLRQTHHLFTTANPKTEMPGQKPCAFFSVMFKSHNAGMNTPCCKTQHCAAHALHESSQHQQLGITSSRPCSCTCMHMYMHMLCTQKQR